MRPAYKRRKFIDSVVQEDAVKVKHIGKIYMLIQHNDKTLFSIEDGDIGFSETDANVDTLRAKYIERVKAHRELEWESFVEILFHSSGKSTKEEPKAGFRVEVQYRQYAKGSSFKIWRDDAKSTTQYRAPLDLAESLTRLSDTPSNRTLVNALIKTVTAAGAELKDMLLKAHTLGRFGPDMQKYVD